MKIILSFILFLLCAAHANAQDGRYDIDPHSYKSKNGRYELFINPSNRYGAGPAEYKLSLDGKELWKKQLAYTFINAAVADDGSSAGYGLTKGTGWFANGEFIVAILSRDGSVVAEDRTPQTDSPFEHVSPEPNAKSLVLDITNDRVIISFYRMGGRTMNEWWIYQLSTGKKIGVAEPKSFMDHSDNVSIDIVNKLIESTPLILVQWLTFDPSRGRTGSQYGTRFTLVDLQYKPIWSLEWPSDYTIPKDKDAQRALHTEIRKAGAVIKTEEPRRFTLRQVATSKAITFEVTKDESNKGCYYALEISRADYKSPSQQNADQRGVEVPRPTKQLKFLGEIRLNESRAESRPAFNEIVIFRFDPKGRIFIVTRRPTGQKQLSLIDTNGRILHSFQAPGVFTKEIPITTISHATGNLWMLAGSNHDLDVAAGFFDITTGAFTPLPKLNVAGASNIEYTNDGEFILFIASSICKSDKEGHIKWAIGVNSKSGEKLQMEPAGMALTSDDNVVVFDSVSKNVFVYDTKGIHKNTITIDEDDRRLLGNFVRIAADRDGGFVISAHAEPQAYLHIDRNGKTICKFTPKWADGREAHTGGIIGVGPDYTYWIMSHGRKLFRFHDETFTTGFYQLDENGIIIKVNGSDPAVPRLEQIDTLEIDRNDRIYAVDRDSGSIKKFDNEGRESQICSLAPGDHPKEPWQHSLMITDGGDAFVQVAGGIFSESDKFIQFDPAGRRVGEKKLPIDIVSEGWFSKPNNTGYWIVGPREVFLLDNTWKVINKNERNESGGWLQTIESARCAADGTLAIFDTNRETRNDTIHIYESDGRARNSFVPPSFNEYNNFAFDGSRFVFIKELNEYSEYKSDCLALAFDSSGNCLFEFNPPEMEGIRGAYFTKNGNELLLFDGAFTLYRYEMPPAVKPAIGR